MSTPPPAPVRLDDETIDKLATRLAHLLTTQAPAPPAAAVAGEMLTAAQVAERWNIDRSWVYQHATELGAARLGNGRRPRLRFDPERVTAYLNPTPTATPRTPGPAPVVGGGSSRLRGDHAELLPIRGHSELSSPGPAHQGPTPGANAPSAPVPPDPGRLRADRRPPAPRRR